MDIQPQTTQPISDDQELAKVLAGVTNDSGNNFNFKATPTIMPIPTPIPIPTPNADPEPKDPMMPLLGQKAPITTIVQTDLETIKKNALTELRPLVDKLDLSPEEKFDIYLLLLRSTDDTTLIAPAHETAQKIDDESKRAQALLDVIKEIDFLSNPIPASI